LQKKLNTSARHSRAGNVPSHIDLRPALCHAFCDSKNLMGYMLIDVIFSAVGADLGGDIFHDKGHPVPVKRDRGRTLLGFAVFTDYALHAGNGNLILFLYFPLFLPFKKAALYIIEIVRQPFMTLFGIIPGSGFVALDKTGHINRSKCLCERMNAFFSYFTDCFHRLTPP
jgi:hypothetical protein